MSKFYTFFIILGALFMAGSVHATVGGPTYISEIAFSAPGNAVYYKVHDGGGRGCPPIVHKIDLVTMKDTEVKSCNQVEQEYSYDETGQAKYSQFIADIYENLSYLGSVSLKKNNIDVKVNFLSEHIQDDFVFWSNFRATITQDNKEIGKIDFKGCSKDQPHVFEGYMIPSSNSIAILISNKGDCFEGGYVKEILSVVKGVSYYNKNIVRDIKTATATEPNAGNLVVYAGAAPIVEPETPGASPTTNDTTQKSTSNYVIYALVAIILGLGLGYFFGRKRGK